MNASEIVDKMYNNDAFSIWLGIRRIKDGPGESILEMKVRDEMTNGFGIAHGGITYSLADSALAFASNSHGKQAVSIETSISHLTPVRSGDMLTAHAIEESLNFKIGVYRIEILNQDEKKVALFKGTVYRSSREWEK